MSQVFIVDTSVVAKWFIPDNESYVKEANALFAAIEKYEIEVFAPSFLLIELTNILLRKKGLQKSLVEQVIQKLHTLRIQFIEFDGEQVHRLIEICDAHGLTTYDALYLLLAQEKDCPLITADYQLLQIKEKCVSLEEWI